VRTRAVLAGAATATVLLAGCGQIDAPGAAARATTAPAATTKPALELVGLPAKQVVARTSAALKGAGTVHVVGNFVSAGESATLDLKIKGTQGAIGTIKVRGATLTMLRNGSNTYLKSDAAGWTKLGAGAGASLLAGKWVKVSSADPNFAEMADFTRLDKLAAMFLEDDFSAAKVAKAMFGGKAVVKVSDVSGTMLIAATGKPYPLKVVQVATSASADAGSLEFSDFGKPVTLTEPPADQVLDTTGLTG
jgi:hypothetical protein